MKFARYLEETQIPEWKKAYIDYRGLKKKITAVRRANEAARAQEQSPEMRMRSHDHARSSITDPSPAVSRIRRRSYGAVWRTPPNALKQASSDAIGPTPPGANKPSKSHERTPSGCHLSHTRPSKSPHFRLSADELGPDFELPPAMSSVESLGDGTICSHTSAPIVEPPRAIPSRVFNGTLSVVPSRNETPRESIEEIPRPVAPPPVIPTIPTIPSTNEPRTPRNPFSGMRRRFTQTSRHSKRNDHALLPVAPTSVEQLLAGIGPNELAFFTALDQEIDKVDKFFSERERDARLKVIALKEQFHELRGHKQLSANSHDGLWPGFLHLLNSINIASLPIPGPNKSADASAKAETPLSNAQAHVGSSVAQDPEAYQRAKKKLKKAVLEFYRGLELLQNYRILNMTGFRKALKKFDKVTKMTTQDLYMRDRIEIRSFASGDNCDNLLKEIERIYATRFERGDEKKARARLRAAPRQSTHHFSTFRSGFLIGMAVPVLSLGISYSLEHERREQIPEWAALLQVYAALSIPVIFALLFALNLIAWARARINFIFIFELDARTVIDAREYLELPAFLFATLAHAFWLSFARYGAETIDPTSWPIIWVGLAIVVIANPFPIFHRSARWWLLRTVGGLFLSGWTRVEFKDFWMGDQLCSLVYTISNFYFLACAYVDSWHHIEQRCQLGPHWSIPLALSALPSLIRLVQCIRRYADSKNHIHLVNGGKYTASIVAFVAYYGWRHFGSRRDFRFGMWILFATINSCYTTYWDLTMDWSLLQFKGVQYKFLRKELAYSNHIPSYYMAIVTNVIIRFIWIWYIPRGGLPAGTRGFIFAILEMLRRVQWNFYRLENEHIGNADQFRATREVPLPYVFTGDADSDDENGKNMPRRRMSIRLPSRRSLDVDVEADSDET